LKKLVCKKLLIFFIKSIRIQKMELEVDSKNYDVKIYGCDNDRSFEGPLKEHPPRTDWSVRSSLNDNNSYSGDDKVELSTVLLKNSQTPKFQEEPVSLGQKPLVSLRQKKYYSWRYCLSDLVDFHELLDLLQFVSGVELPTTVWQIIYDFLPPRENVFLKFVIVGDKEVGKTSLAKQYVDKEFSEQYKPTIGADFVTVKDVIVDDKIVKMQIWDTAGQERFRSMAVSFFRGSDCGILVYDITDVKSFQRLQYWKDEVLNNCMPKDKEKFPFIIIGNKCDLNASRRQVTEVRAKEWSSETNNMLYFETSAREAVNVDQAFLSATKLAIRQMKTET